MSSCTRRGCPTTKAAAAWVLFTSTFRQFAILPGHPTGDHGVRATLVEAVQPLDGHAEPARAAWDGAQPFQLLIGALGISVEADQHRSRSGSRRRNCQIAAMDRGGYDSFLPHVSSWSWSNP